ncbi:hypothetical protein GF319_12855 [Candidatus Bathyarchaeota archaeon]|nr:hypothetical protein [Candidatus Bathyarchaeota archaeon]
MPIREYLLSSEYIKYWSDFNVNYAGQDYKIYITNLRLLMFKAKGLFFGNEEIITETWRQITGLQYNETGKLSRKGQFKFTGSNGEFILEGPKKGMLGLFKVIQRQTLEPE